MGGPLDEVLKKNEKTHEKRMMKAEQSKKKEATNIKMNELIYIWKLGIGQFGNVYLVKAKFNNQYYALKQFHKQ